jgi:CxxC-x17-CxxC domain-containing protein
VAYTDKTLTCLDCGAEFTFSAEDQPKRCPSCRQARKAGRQGGREGGYRGGYGSGERQMYPAVCADCGQQTEVPFQPRGDRPVYCRDCFAKRSPARSRW